MTPESAKFDRLETEYRDPVQAELLIALFGMNDDTAHLKWIDTNGKLASDIMDGDSEAGSQIRDLARKRNYKEAAILLLRELSERQGSRETTQSGYTGA